MSKAAVRKLRVAIGQIDVVLDLMRQLAEASGIQDQTGYRKARAAGEETKAALERLAKRAQRLPPGEEQ